MKSKDDKKTLTLEQIRRQQATLAALERQAEELQVEEETLGREIVKALAAGDKQQDAKALRVRRRNAREQRADILEALPLLREQIRRQRKQVGSSEATKRFTGISRAFGLLAQELTDDETKVFESAKAYKSAVDQLNKRFKALALLRAEADALADRFGLTRPEYAPVVLPAHRDGCLDAASIVAEVSFLDRSHRIPVMEKCEHQLRRRRTYEEIKGSPAFEIIEAAGGPKDWSPLNERQLEIIASRKADAEAERKISARIGPEIAAAQAMPGPGNVLRR